MVLQTGGGPGIPPPAPPSPHANSTFLGHSSHVHRLTSPPQPCQGGGLELLSPGYKWGN